MEAKPRTRSRRGWVFLALVAAGALALLTQEAAAQRLAGLLAGLWVSVMSVVVRLIGAVFGGG